MTAGDTTPGRRVHDKEPHEYDPGDYGQWREQWFCRAPVDDYMMTGNLSRHTVTEHEDGTITVSPSILMEQGRHAKASPGWHGYLERGVWREV